jgi:excisionase family DNA binding protein
MKVSNTQTKHPNTQGATYSPDELARVLGVARNTVYANLRAGKIPHVKMGRRFVIPRAAVDAWFAAVGQQPTARGARRA